MIVLKVKPHHKRKFFWWFRKGHKKNSFYFEAETEKDIKILGWAVRKIGSILAKSSLTPPLYESRKFLFTKENFPELAELAPKLIGKECFVMGSMMEREEYTKLDLKIAED